MQAQLSVFKDSLSYLNQPTQKIPPTWISNAFILSSCFLLFFLRSAFVSLAADSWLFNSLPLLSLVSVEKEEKMSVVFLCSYSMYIEREAARAWEVSYPIMSFYCCYMCYTMMLNFLLKPIKMQKATLWMKMKMFTWQFSLFADIAMAQSSSEIPTLSSWIRTSFIISL